MGSGQRFKAMTHAMAVVAVIAAVAAVTAVCVAVVRWITRRDAWSE